MKERFWYTCPFCGSKASNGLCYGCGNNNLPDMSFENKSDYKFIGFYAYQNMEEISKYIYNEIFVDRNENAPEKSDDADTKMKEAMEWHDLTDNPYDTPNRGLWFVCKIKGSDNLKLVVGFENVNADRFDAWVETKCPF